MTDSPSAHLKFSARNLKESVASLLSRVRSTMANMINQRTTCELGITGTQGGILFMVWSEKCLLAAELAREFGIDASAVTRRIDLLEARGLLRRVRSVEDRRLVRLALTPEGEAMAARMAAINASVVDKLLSGFTSEETGFLRSMLHRVLANSGNQRD
ncbi:DNA-binding transcriptional regulator, MarR family [Paraburkholderia hospita]|nr:MarR family transcriptional regulator [Paraburkholderia hospita]SKD05514.1 DNA-binding transcriptional regulator, MarR family [Paraburkholderia hospita]